MANHKSTIKAHKQSLARRANNRESRSRLRRSLKAVRAAIDTGDGSAATDSLRRTVSLIDKLAHKGIIHANTAARYKSRLTRRLRQASA